VKVFRHLIFTLLFFASAASRAAFLIDVSTNYHSDEDDVTTFTYSRFDYRGFLAASLDSKQKFYFGQNVSQFGRDFKNGSTTGKYSVLELGPRFQYYFSGERTFYMSAAWNPYVKGSRTVGTTEEDISGSSYFINLGWQLKIGRSFSLGASINYHAISITKETDTNNVETDVTDSYTTIYPMLEFSFRFR
jgi:hypothetical protein